MKVTLLAENIQTKLPHLLHAVSSRSQLPILNNILFQAEEGSITLSATDLEIGIRIQIPAKVEEKGEITIPAKTFSEIVGSLPSGNIGFTLDGQTLVMKTKHTTSKFQITPKDEFPSLYEEKGEELLRLKKSILKKEFQKVVFAASVDVGRPALSGILFSTDEEGGVLLVATDGYRLSLKKFPMKQKEKADTEETLLISARVIKEALLLKDEDEIVIYASKTKNQIVFEQQDTLLVGRLIDAQFPPYQKIIPQSATTTVVVDRSDIEKAVKMCAVFARESSNIVRFTVGKEGIDVSAGSSQVGENNVFVEAVVTGEGGTIAFNARYLLDLFANVEEKELVLEMTTATSPGVFKVQKDSSFLHLIMPIRLQE